MKRNVTLCPCGSGRPKELCCHKKLHVKVWSKALDSPQEHQELLADLKISAEFDMRYRGLLEYYGKDLIAYKRIHPLSTNCNEFLRHFSKYMTTYLEDNCPPSWDQCNSSFWEELIFTYVPLFIKITPQKKEVEKFLSQLKSFIHWLDKRVGTSWHEIVNNYAEEANPMLHHCEQLLNQLFLMEYPTVHQSDWNLEQEIERNNQEFHATADRLESIFEVTRVLEDTVILTELKTKRDYPIKGLPCSLIYTGMLIDGIIFRRSDAMFWNWFLTNCVFPERARKYIKVV